MEEHTLEDGFEKLVEECKDTECRDIHSYFTRVSQIKEQLEAVEEEVENAEVVCPSRHSQSHSVCFVHSRFHLGSIIQLFTILSRKLLFSVVHYCW